MAKAQLVIDAYTRIEIIEQLMRRIQEHYVFPDVAQLVEEELRRKMRAGEYDQHTTGELFCLFLTAHLQEISHDKHFFLVYHPRGRSTTEHESSNIDEHEGGRLQNFGFQRVERLQRTTSTGVRRSI